MKICKKLVLGFVMCLTLIGVANVEANANEPIDVDAKGSITAEYKYDDNPLAGVNFKVYRVATVSADEVYTAIAPFGESGVDFNQLNTQEGWQLAVTKLDMGIVASKVTADYEVKTDEDGYFLLQDVPTGMYFIQIDSFIHEGMIAESESILYPLQVYSDETFTWDYDLKIVPKTELREEEKPDIPDDPDTPKENNDKEIPQTGSFEWLVPILASIGLAFIAVGMLCKRKGEEDEV